MTNVKKVVAALLAFLMVIVATFEPSPSDERDAYSSTLFDFSNASLGYCQPIVQSTSLLFESSGKTVAVRVCDTKLIAAAVASPDESIMPSLDAISLNSKLTISAVVCSISVISSSVSVSSTS